VNVRRTTIGLLMVLLCNAATAHEVRTAYLEMTEAQPELFEVQWKQPVTAGRLSIEPILPQDCEPLSAPSPSRAGNLITERWTTRCGMRTGLIGVTGLSAAHTETIVRINYLDGDVMEQILRPSNPRVALSDAPYGVGGYFVIGVEHMLFGIDHVLFVVGLVLFIRQPWPLVKTVTAFTVAHSITLVLSVLDLVRLPQGPVEAVIALSILFLARELMVPYHRQSRITHLAPWLMAFAFGLLHGFGFAGALAEIGLPRGQLALSLLLFNVGIEVAQLCVIAAMLAVGWLTGRLLQHSVPLMERGLAAVIGCVAAFWTIDRVVALA
jgi:hydrogenase/urease accessory protein HupE